MADDPELARRLDDWVGHGLLSPDQARAIAAHEHDGWDDTGAGHAWEGHVREVDGRERDGRRWLVAEAVGYVGVVLAVAAGVLVAGEFWDRIAPWARVLLSGLVTAAALAAGAALRSHTHPAVQRLTSVLWFTGTAGVALTAGLAAGQRRLPDADVALAVLASVALAGGLLYTLRHTPLQLVAFTVGVAGTAVATLARPRAQVDELWFGLLLWGLGVVWLLLAHGGWLRPPTAARVLGLLAIGIGGQVGTFGAHAEVALLLALGTAAVLVWVSVRTGDTVVLAFAVAGIFAFVPQTVVELFGDQLGAPLALLLTGLLLVAAAVGMVVLRREIVADPPGR